MILHNSRLSKMTFQSVLGNILPNTCQCAGWALKQQFGISSVFLQALAHTSHIYTLSSFSDTNCWDVKNSKTPLFSLMFESWLGKWSLGTLDIRLESVLFCVVLCTEGSK